MKIRLKVTYPTAWGEQVCVSGSCPALGTWFTDAARSMTYHRNDEWRLDLDLPDDRDISFEYKYIIKNDGRGVRWEGGHNRTLQVLAKDPVRAMGAIECLDAWRDPSDPESVFLTSAFQKVIFARKGGASTSKGKSRRTSAGKSAMSLIRFRVTAPRVQPGETVYLVGGIPEIGKWDSKKAVAMDARHFPIWTVDIPLKSADKPFSYKYLLKGPDGAFVAYESGDYRTIASGKHDTDAKISAGQAEKGKRKNRPGSCVRMTDDAFAFPDKWRGAGVAVPVFSLRSERGLGVGEFPDIKLLADWADQSGFRLVQLLPVNDTSVNRMWWDSYPYSNLSVFALHPLYLHLPALGNIPKKMADEIAAQQEKLNACNFVNYEEVMAVKTKYAREIFAMKKEQFLSSADFKGFFEENAFWLKPYAVFCSLRDLHETSDFTKWGKHSTVTPQEIDLLASPESACRDAVAFYYFLQYHLHEQLKEAASYAASKRVVLKGDIPIGINKQSDSCWLARGLFHMDQSAGAPPDPFSDTGQNWGFPTYNWEAMEHDGYAWWRKRLAKMSDYFQMIRLDHVLGFFRIWEIPDEHISGLMGHFNPAIPLWRDELEKQGIWDFDRLCEPYIPLWLVRILFGAEATTVMATYLEAAGQGQFRLRHDLRTQKQIEAFFTTSDSATIESKIKTERVRAGLLYLVTNVVLFRDKTRSGFHPRINMMDTPAFATLDEWMKERLVQFYNDYFYHRQDDFWRAQAMMRLPVLKDASDMLICGEDLGMVPECVPPVMRELCILGLRIQRMPKEPGREFGIPGEYGYLTVCTTSSHDMSTIRGWWGEDPARAKRYYATVLKKKGDVPSEAGPALCREIIADHLASPSMWAIFPIQDILAMSESLRRPGDPREEQINDPANPHHYWKFRLHLPLEKLLAEKKFCAEVRALVEGARNV